MAKAMVRAFVMKALPAGVLGFIDNFVMIMVGEYIDANLARALRIGTLGAAGYGNTISDIVAVLGQDRVENALSQIGLDADSVGDEKDSRLASISGMVGGIFGVTIGCLVGMFPLLFAGTDSEIKIAGPLPDNLSPFENSLVEPFCRSLPYSS